MGNKIKVNFYETTLVTPVPDVVSLNLIQCQGVIDFDDDNELLELYRGAAIDRIEKMTNRLLRPATVVCNAPFEDLTKFERYPFVELERNPCRAVTRVEVHNGTDFEDVPADSFLVEQKAGYWRVQLYPYQFFRNYIFPVDVPYPIRVTFDAGYLDGTVPHPLRLAVAQYAVWLWNNRGDCSDENIPDAILNLIGQYRILRTFG